MRHLLFITCLFLSPLLGAQCSISATFAGTECNGDSTSFFVLFDVAGTGGTSWFSPTINAEGPYDTDELFRAGPFVTGSLDTIVFVDQGNPGCEAFIVVPEPSCGTNESCDGFQITTSNTVTDDDSGCGAQVNVSVSVNRGTFPILVVLTAANGGAQPDSMVIVSPTDTVTFSGVPTGTYLVRASDESGCVATATVTSAGGGGLPVRFEFSGGLCVEVDTATATAVVPVGSGNYTYAWNTGETTATIIVTGEFFQYEVLVTDLTTGCTWTGDFLGSEALTGSPERFNLSLTIPCDADSVFVDLDSVYAGFDYQWFGPQNTIIDQAEFYATASGFYNLRATNGEGCTISGNLQITDASLDDYFFELFGFQDSICGEFNCVAAELSIPFNLLQDGTFTAFWEGPDEEQINALNADILNSQFFFCTDFPGLYRLTIASECDTVFRSIVLADPTACSSLSGTLYLDEAGDCDLDTEDSGVPNYIITLTNTATGEVYYEMTDAAGSWSASLPLGDYVVEPSLLPGAPFTRCSPPVTVTLGNFPVTDVNVFLPATIACAQMSTTVSMPFLRRCFSSLAWVEYKNLGSVTAENATLTVQLDDFFTDVTTSVPASVINGQTYTFELGDVPPFSSGIIRFNFTVSCTSTLGQSHCVEASVTPDKPCVTPDNWGGALVAVAAVGCDGDSVRFNVTNIGEETMSIPLTYVIVEDGIMLTPVPNVNGQLAPGEMMTIATEATGATVHLITNQEPNAPADEEPTAVLEGCSTGGNQFSTGFTNILPLRAGPTTTSVVCRQNVGSYDPNDKRGFPLGYGDSGDKIALNTRLDYNIRFQNTGTDTAFTVIIVDTLPASLDLATIKLGVASHPYTVSLDTHRVLTFVFENILLPDSTTNLEASQGVVTFTIDHAAELRTGDLILNEAAIYFDFNEPIITNLSRHEIAKDGLPVSVRRVAAQAIPLSVFPNPVGTELTVIAPNAELSVTDRVRITDLYGRTLIDVPFVIAADGLDVRALPAGYYLTMLTDEQGRVRGRTGFVVAR